MGRNTITPPTKFTTEEVAALYLNETEERECSAHLIDHLEGASDLDGIFVIDRMCLSHAPNAKKSRRK